MRSLGRKSATHVRTYRTWDIKDKNGYQLDKNNLLGKVISRLISTTPLPQKQLEGCIKKKTAKKRFVIMKVRKSLTFMRKERESSVGVCQALDGSTS